MWECFRKKSKKDKHENTDVQNQRGEDEEMHLKTKKEAEDRRREEELKEGGEEFLVVFKDENIDKETEKE